MTTEAVQQSTPAAEARQPLDPIVAEIVRARKARGLSQQTVADIAGISRRSLGAIEAGHDCSLSTVRALCAAVDVELQAQLPKSRPTLDDVTEENRRDRFGSRERGG
jgi:DNA-binding XRE family transcriptional regulator